MRFFLLIIFFISLTHKHALSYPDMVRHGYINCTSCHVSPTGGGVLTQYGRELSSEILSQTAYSGPEGIGGESQFTYGMLKPPEWLHLGGDFRSLAIVKNTPTTIEGKAILMQADVEAIASYMNFMAGGTILYQENPKGGFGSDNIVSRRHYINYWPMEKISIRAGRFMPSFGINTPDHAIVTKRGLNWDQGSETYNVESAWIGEKYNAYITGILGRPDNTKLNREKGFALNTSTSILDQIKTGLSYYYGFNDNQSRQIFGAWGIIGISPSFYIISEVDSEYKSTFVDTEKRLGLVNYNKIAYEVFKGFHTFSTIELQNTNFQDDNQTNKFVGFGIQYFPRPHFEFNLTIQRQLFVLSRQPTDIIFFLFHYYL